MFAYGFKTATVFSSCIHIIGCLDPAVFQDIPAVPALRCVLRGQGFDEVMQLVGNSSKKQHGLAVRPIPWFAGKDFDDPFRVDNSRILKHRMHGEWKVGK
jgi:hypothetical protein